MYQSKSFVLSFTLSEALRAAKASLWVMLLKSVSFTCPTKSASTTKPFLFLHDNHHLCDKVSMVKGTSLFSSPTSVNLMDEDTSLSSNIVILSVTVPIWLKFTKMTRVFISLGQQAQLLYF